MAIKKLDKLILVGFQKIDGTTEAGRSARTHLMDIFSLGDKDIYFYEAGTDPKEIVRSSFMKDPSQKDTGGFRIGKALCLVSDSVSAEYKQSIKNLRVLKIEVNIGMQNVRLEEMSESETIQWVKTGKYTPSSETKDDEPKTIDNSTDTDDELDDRLEEILFSDNDDDDEYTENVDEIGVDEEPNNDNEAEEYVEREEREEREERVEREERTDHSNDDFIEETPKDTAPSPDSEKVIETRFGGEVADSSESFLDDFDDLEDTEDFDDLFDDETDHGTSDAEYADLSGYSSDTDKQEYEEAPKKPNRHAEDEKRHRKSDYDEIDEEIEEVDEILKHTPQSMENQLIVENEKKKKLALLKKKKQERQKLKEKKDKPKIGVNKTELESSILTSKVDTTLEPRYTEDGRAITSKDMLDERQRAQADVEFEMAREFGDLDEPIEGEDSSYVGKDTGRIILVTSGKGGVGKSLVSSGLATALVLARAKYRKDNPQARNDDVWLIESDYNSPQLAITYEIDSSRHLGNVASYLAKSKGRINARELSEVINANTHVDPRTGLKILACPPLSQRSSNKNIPFAIISAIKYASDNGDDVIIDHGNLTDAAYSALDHALSIKIAHRVLIVTDMSSLKEAQSVISMITQRNPYQSISSTRPAASVAVALNSAGGEAQYRIAQEKLGSFKIVNWIQAIPNLRPENSMTGETNLNTLPESDRKAVIDRTGYMLTNLGYPDLGRYFSGNSKIRVGVPKKRSLARRLVDYLAK